MLVLTMDRSGAIILHRNGEVIARVVVVDTYPGKVRLGFTAKNEIEIDRDVIYDKKHPPAKNPKSKPTETTVKANKRPTNVAGR